MIKKRFSEYVIDTQLFVCLWDTDDVEWDVKTYGEYIDEDRSIVINMDEVKTKTIFMKTLVHELLHFVGYNLRRKWIDYTAMTEEIYCYLYDFYFGKIYKWIENNDIMKWLK